jgi:hypothetical protein
MAAGRGISARQNRQIVACAETSASQAGHLIG